MKRLLLLTLVALVASAGSCESTGFVDQTPPDTTAGPQDFGDLTQTIPVEPLGFEIRYPADWHGFAQSSGPFGATNIGVDEAEIAREYPDVRRSPFLFIESTTLENVVNQAGFDPSSGVEGWFQFNRGARFPWPEDTETEEVSLFGAPSLRFKAFSEQTQTEYVHYLGLGDETPYVVTFGVPPGWDLSEMEQVLDRILASATPAG